MTRSKFFIAEHKAKRAGLHWDIRFKMPKSNDWASFACRKKLPDNPGEKILAVRTHDHTEKEAIFVGTIESGYGAGTIKKWDGGSCDIIRYTPGRHISIDFKGSKLKGIYHFISTQMISKDSSGEKGESYLFFKGKIGDK